METLLWHQNANLNGPDIFVINGNLSSYSSDDIQNAAFEKLTSCQKWSEFSYDSSQRNGIDSISPQLHIYYNFRTNEIMVQSHFVDVDERDRRIPFMYYQDKVTSIDDVASSICESARIAEKEINTADLKIIQKAVSFSLRKKLTHKVFIAATAIIVISVIVLCKKN